MTQPHEDQTVAGDRGSMESLDRHAGSKRLVGGLLAGVAILFVAYHTFSESPQRKSATGGGSGRITAPIPPNLDLPEPQTATAPPPPPPQEEEIITLGELRASAPPIDDSIVKRRMEGGFNTLGNVPTSTNTRPSSADSITQDDPTIAPPIREAQGNSRVSDYDTQGVAKAVASRIGNRSLILTQGAKVPCTLETALDSSVPGMTSCIVSQDIYSSDGLVRLIDRGSKLNGRYNSEMKIGQVRIAIVWERLETPEGVLINLSSDGIDTLGRAGTGGWVDTHFWERFGHAIMFSLVSDGFQYINNLQSKNNNPRYFSDTEKAGQDMARIALEHEIDLKPTLHKNQGEPIMVFLNKDLSFEDVYELDIGKQKSASEALRDRLGK